MADHWVPQCYLKNFEISSGGSRVYVYERGKPPFPAGIHNVAAENDRYTFIHKKTGDKVRDIEEMFSRLEDATAPVLQKIAKEKILKNLDSSEYGALTQFIAFLATRGPTFENILKNHYKEAFKLTTEMRAEHPDILRKEFSKAGVIFKNDEEFEEARKSLLNLDKLNFRVTGGKGYFFEKAVKTAKDITNIFQKEKGLFLLVSRDSRVFITSDNPVIIQVPPDIPWWLSGGYKYGTILVTISPQVCLVFRSRPLKKQIIEVGQSQVDYINNSIMKSAKRQIYSNLSSKNIKQRFDLSASGEDSKVTSHKMKYAPYTFIQGSVKDKELPAIDRHSMSWKEIEAEIEKNNANKIPLDNSSSEYH